MPFRLFRRYRRTMLALLAIFAMFAFVLADSLPRLMQPSQAAGVDEVVVELYGDDVRRSDLNRLRYQRILANNVLAQTGFFGPEPFGPTDDRSIIDAFILERQADDLDLPATIELAKAWIYDRARQQYEYLRLLQPTLGELSDDEIASRLQMAFEGTYGDRMTDVQFLEEVANQVRILQALELMATSMSTPLDAFGAYRDSSIRVNARFAAFPAADFLEGADEAPVDDEAARAFFEEYRDRLPDPSTGTVGFRVPRRVKLEYLMLGVDAIEALRAAIAEQPLAERVRDEPRFADDVLAAYRDEQGAAAVLDAPLPVDLFAGDPDAELTPPPASFVDRFVGEQVAERSRRLLLERIEELFEPVKDGMDLFLEDLDVAEVEFATGAEADVDRGAIPRLDQLLGPQSEPLAEAMGDRLRSAEGVSYTGIGLTDALADPAVLGEFIGGIPLRWSNYLAMVGLDWGRVSPRVLDSLRFLSRAQEGLEEPDVLSGPSPERAFTATMLDPDTPLFDPREYTDPQGRRFLVWKTLDLPETSRPFDAMREHVVASWRLERARERAREAAEAFAARVLESASEGLPPARAMMDLSLAEDIPTGSTGDRLKVDPPDLFGTLDVGEELRDALFDLDPEGDEAVAVAPDRSESTFYALALERRGDDTGPFGAPSAVDYETAVARLPSYQGRLGDEGSIRRLRSLMEYLRQQAGLPEDWSPTETDRG